MRSMRTIRYVTALSLFLIITALTAVVGFNVPDIKHNVTGNDISFPQCGENYPEDQAFGIVGVNGGVPTKTNPCLASQLRWAINSSGDGFGQQRLQLYVNTANPGHLPDAPGWPKDNGGIFELASPNPHGICDGSNSLACSWQYGWDRASEAVYGRFAPAAREAGINDDPSRYPWWLDIETLNSWQSGAPDSLRKNAASLEGMVAYYQSLGIKVGMYSTSYQFGVIAGKPGPESNLNGLDSWLAGGVDAESSKRMCGFPPLTPGGRVVMVQYVQDGFDFNYSCL